MSQFWTLMDDEFGSAYSRVFADRHVLSAIGGQTVSEAIDAGVPPKCVWEVLCEAMDIPPERRLGRDNPGLPTRPEPEEP